MPEFTPEQSTLIAEGKIKEYSEEFDMNIPVVLTSIVAVFLARKKNSFFTESSLSEEHRTFLLRNTYMMKEKTDKKSIPYPIFDSATATSMYATIPLSERSENACILVHKSDGGIFAIDYVSADETSENAQRVIKQIQIMLFQQSETERMNPLIIPIKNRHKALTLCYGNGPPLSEYIIETGDVRTREMYHATPTYVQASGLVIWDNFVMDANFSTLEIVVGQNSVARVQLFEMVNSISIP